MTKINFDFKSTCLSLFLMKKALVFILLVCYFTVSTGFVVSFHYCMDKFDSVQLGSEEDDECGKCGMHSGENACCFDDVKVVKLDDSHVAAQALLANFSLPPAIVQGFNFFIDPPISPQDPWLFQMAHGPPWQEQKINIFNCVFRI